MKRIKLSHSARPANLSMHSYTAQHTKQGVRILWTEEADVATIERGNVLADAIGCRTIRQPDCRELISRARFRQWHDMFHAGWSAIRLPGKWVFAKNGQQYSSLSGVLDMIRHPEGRQRVRVCVARSDALNLAGICLTNGMEGLGHKIRAAIGTHNSAALTLSF